MRKYLLILFLLLAAVPVSFAQATETESAASVSAQAEAAGPDVEMADALRRDGKIYVVVAVIVTVLAGLLLYLIRLDRKVSKLEQQFKN